MRGTGSRGTGEEAAGRLPQLRQLLMEHGPFVARSLRHHGVVESDIDDVVQEVFLVVHQRMNDYEEQGRVRGWLYAICARVALAYRRKSWRRRESCTLTLPVEPTQPTQLASIEDRESLELGYSLLNQLNSHQRDVFLLYEVEGLSMPEIAQSLNCPLQTAYSRLNQARARILAAVETHRTRVEHE